MNKEEAILSYAYLFHKMVILKPRDPILRDTAPNTTYRNTLFLCHVTLACAVRFKIFFTLGRYLVSFECKKLV